MKIRFLSLSCLVVVHLSSVAIANERAPGDKRGPILDAIISSIENGDREAFENTAGEFAIRQLEADDTRGYQQIYRFDEFRTLVEGCKVDFALEPKDKVKIVRNNTKSFGNGTIAWACDGRPAPDKECHDVFIIAAVRQYLGDKTYHYLHFGISSRFSRVRCGDDSQ